jgi:hypothetical protein
VSLETTRTRQRILVANCLLVVATLETRLTRPRFRLGFETDVVLLTDARETVNELLERPEVVRLLVHLTDQCDSSTSVNSPTCTVATPSSYCCSRRGRRTAEVHQLPWRRYVAWCSSEVCYVFNTWRDVVPVYPVFRSLVWPHTHRASWCASGRSRSPPNCSWKTSVLISDLSTHYSTDDSILKE